MNIRQQAGIYALIVALVLGIFAVDLMLPLGIAVWVIYLLPVRLAYMAPRPLVPSITAVAVFAAMVAGLMLARDGIDPTIAATNRSMAIVVIMILGMSGFAFVRNRMALRQQDWLQQGDGLPPEKWSFLK